MERENGMDWKIGLAFAAIMTALICVYSVALGKLAISEAWAGFLFYWFWSSIRKFDIKSLAYDVPNSIAGIAIGWLMFSLLNAYGLTVYEIVIAIMLLVILFFSITKLIPHVIGDTTFMFVTVLTGNTMLAEANYAQIAISYLTGVIFFGVTLGFIVKLLSKKKNAK